MRSFVIIKSSRNGEITLSFTGISKSCPSRKFLTSQNLRLLTLFAKIKFSRKFPNLQFCELSKCACNKSYLWLSMRLISTTAPSTIISTIIRYEIFCTNEIQNFFEFLSAIIIRENRFFNYIRIAYSHVWNL